MRVRNYDENILEYKDILKLLRLLVGVFIILQIQGCSPVKKAVAYNESIEHFVRHSYDDRVLFEKGAEGLSDDVASHIQHSVEKIESIHSEEFYREIKVYVCATLESFEKHTAMKYPRGVVFGDKLFLSPRLLTMPDSISSILTHELSHLHLAQKIGKYAYFWNIPNWFIEGLATYVSGGGGAENVNLHEAIDALETQTFFVPNENGSIFFIKDAFSYGFGEYSDDPAKVHHMYYRQSAMFVDYLRKRDKESFNELMKQLLNGGAFGPAFRDNYNVGVAEAWGVFVNEIHQQAFLTKP